MSQTFTNTAEAVNTLRQNISPRQRDLEVLEQFVDCTQYEGLADWFDDSKPLWERAPCIRYPIVATAIRSNVDLVLGESRFPTITSSPGEDDSEADGLDEEQSKKVDRALSELFHRTRFKAAARQALEHSQGARSVATIIGVRNGRPFIEHVRSRWCETVEFDPQDSRKVSRLEIRYPYIVPEKQSDGKWKHKVFLYRRAIDTNTDTTYLPVPAPQDGREPPPSVWSPDPNLTVKHGLGFCPVVWYAHMKECSPIGAIDGVAIHERSLDAIRGLDFAISQRHRAALFAGDPQIVEIGVDPGYNPTGTGRSAVMPATLLGGAPSATNPPTGSYAQTGSTSARKKSPGVVWQYEKGKETVEVKYLVLPEGALNALDNEVADLRNKIAESLAVVILDPENIKITGDMSGRAIEMLRGRQFDRCDQIRDDFADNWILPVVHMLLRVVLKARVAMKALQAVRSILAKFIDDEALAPLLFVRWSRGYTAPDPTEEQVVVTAVTQAKDGGIITTRMAVEKLAPMFGITNIDQAVAKVEEERDANQKKALENAAALAPKPVEDKSAPPKAEKPKEVA